VLNKLQQIEIKERYESGESERCIAREMEISRQAVRKYVECEDFNLEISLDERGFMSRTLTEVHREKIDEWLVEDKKLPRKYRRTIQRIYDILREKQAGDGEPEYPEYTGSYETVKRYITGKRRKEKAVSAGYLPLERRKGAAQIDFGEMRYYEYEGEKETNLLGHKGFELIVSFEHSNKGFSQVFKSCNTECLLSGLQRIFEHIGCVPVIFKTDNMSTAVAKIHPEGVRDLTDSFMRFKLHHRFREEFCNPAAGNEKGNVENKVGTLRRNLLVPFPVITDWKTFNDELLLKCDERDEQEHYLHKKPINKLFLEDKKECLPLPKVRYEVFRFEICKIDKVGFISIDTNKYGVSPELSGQNARVKIFFDKIEIYALGTMVAQYPRCYEKHREISDFKHYLRMLSRKPGGIGKIRFWGDFPDGWREYLENLPNFSEKKKGVELLSRIVEDGHADIADEILKTSIVKGKNDIEDMKHWYFSLSTAERENAEIETEKTLPTFTFNTDLSDYNRICGGGFRGEI
jgi:transposase